MSEPTRADSKTDTTPGSRRGPLLIAMVAALLVIGVGSWACYVWVTSLEGFDYRRFALLGPEHLQLFPAGGRLRFNGEPIDQGYIEVWPADADEQPRRMIGPIQPDGTFEFMTDVDTRLNSGLPEGDYKLLLIVYHPPRPLAAPAPLLPNEYYDQLTTPLRITVTSDPATNHFDLELTGELQPDPRGSREREGAEGNAPAETGVP